MVIDSSSEFEKIRRAFHRVKVENADLKRRLDNVERYLLESNKSSNQPRVVKKVVSENSNDKVYVGNISSGKIHVSNCPYAKKITRDNREIFDSLNDAIKKKYVRCSCISQS